MERKDYAERFNAVKNEIMEEIRKLVPCDNVHKFKETFYIHYVNGEVATTEICNAVEVWNEGMVAFIVFNESGNEEVIEGEGVFQYDAESFLDILDHLQKEVREQKLETIRGVVKANGNRLEFDNKFRFTGFDGDSECEFVGLLALSLNEDGKLNIEDEWQDGLYTNSENFIPDSELDRFIDYVKAQTGQSVILTEKQNEAVENFKAAYAELKKLNVIIVRDNADDKLYFLNGEKIEDVMSADIDSLDIDVTDQMEKNTSCESIISADYWSNDHERVYAKLLEF